MVANGEFRACEEARPLLCEASSRPPMFMKCGTSRYAQLLLPGVDEKPVARSAAAGMFIEVFLTRVMKENSRIFLQQQTQRFPNMTFHLKHCQ